MQLWPPPATDPIFTQPFSDKYTLLCKKCLREVYSRPQCCWCYVINLSHISSGQPSTSFKKKWYMCYWELIEDFIYVYLISRIHCAWKRYIWGNGMWDKNMVRLLELELDGCRGPYPSFSLFPCPTKCPYSFLSLSLSLSLSHLIGDSWLLIVTADPPRSIVAAAV